MATAEIPRCAICGERRSGTKQPWFLLIESRWQDRLKVLHWDAVVAAHPETKSVCGAAHAQELVLHWMITGRLDYPFAKACGRRRAAKVPIDYGSFPEADTSGIALIGELAIHRDSLNRVLQENPQSLSAILHALVSALNRDPSRTPPAAGIQAELAPCWSR
jgi:hypothetical protein